MNCRHELINRLINLNSYTDYLEIGYKEGNTFHRITALNKTAVDPNPLKTNSNVKICTSDEFFSSNTNKYDIIFIDGLHVYEQVKRDFENSLKSLRGQGVIVFHDMNPQDFICGDGKIIKGEIRARSFLDGGCYNGDCYKLAIDFYNNEYDYEYETYDMDEGCMVVYPYLKREKVSNERVEKNYESFAAKRKEILRLIKA
jgi:hypothetical protein